MANALKTLFQEIANAIRNQTGEGDDVKMKPADFPYKIAPAEDEVPVTLNLSEGNQTVPAPDGTLMRSVVITKPDTLIPENIAQGVNIAGIIGALACGGSGGGSGEWVYASGTFETETETDYTLTHNLGVVPDIFIISVFGDMDASELGAYFYLMAYMSLSEKCFGAELCSKYAGCSVRIAPVTNSANLSYIRKGGEHMVKDSITEFGNLTATTVELGGMLGRLVPLETYHWAALARI